MSGSTSFDQACSGDSGPSPGFVKNRGAVSGPGTIGPAHYAFARAVIAETKASVTVTQNGCLGRMQTKSERPFSTQSGHVAPCGSVSPNDWPLSTSTVVSRDGRNTLSLEEKMECGSMGREKSQGVQLCGEDGAVGSLAAGRVTEGDWPCFWQAIVVDLSPACAARWNTSVAASSLEAGLDALGARGDLAGYCAATNGAVDGKASGPIALDGEPRDQPQWRH